MTSLYASHLQGNLGPCFITRRETHCKKALDPDSSAIATRRTRAVSGRATRFKLKILFAWLPWGEVGRSYCHWGSPIQQHKRTYPPLPPSGASACHCSPAGLQQSGRRNSFKWTRTRSKQRAQYASHLKPNKDCAMHVQGASAARGRYTSCPGEWLTSLSAELARSSRSATKRLGHQRVQGMQVSAN